METIYQIKRHLNEINQRLKRMEGKLENQTSLELKWLDHQDVCKILNISKRTLDKYRERGMLPYSKIGGKVFYRLSDIDDYLNNHVMRRREKS